METLKAKKVLLIPGVTTLDLENNENLINSTIMMMTNLLIGFEVLEVYLSDNFEFDYIVTRVKEDATKFIGIKPILVFEWDSLNGGFFFQTYLDLEGKETNQPKNFEQITYLSSVKIDIINL